MLFTSRPLEAAPGAVRVEREHLLQVLKHVVKDPPSSCSCSCCSSPSSAKGPLLKLSLVCVDSLLVGLEVSVKVSLVVGLGVGVLVVVTVVVVVVLLVVVVVRLSELVKVFEKVVKVKGLKVLVEVGVVARAGPGAVGALTPQLVVLPPPLDIRQRLVG